MFEKVPDYTSTLIQDKLLLKDPWYRLIVKMLQSVVPDLNGKRIFEVGCGFGGFCINLARKGAMMVGLDVSPKAIYKARDQAKRFGLQDHADFVVGDAQCLPFKEQSSEITVCSEMLEHVPSYVRAFGELVRITAKSGYLCLTVPNYLSTAIFENVVLLFIGQPKCVKSHVCVEKEHIFHIFKLRRLLDRKGVSVIRIRSVDFLHLPPRVRRFLKVDQSLEIISETLERFFEVHVPPLRLAGANIGVLARISE